MELPIFLGSNLAFIVIMALLVQWTAKTQQPAAVFWMLAWAAAHLFWNLIYHLASVVGYDRHSPGLVTGTLLYLPLSLAVWQAALPEKQLRCTSLVAAIALGGLLMGFIAAVGIYHASGI